MRRSENEFSSQGVKYKFFRSARSDRWLFQARTNYSRLAPGAPPLSTSSLLYPSFARQVAMDLQRQACDVIHIQHCSQCVPIIREYNPKAKIVLHLHAEWFSQGDPRIFERRLKNIDLVTAVSGYVAEKTRRDFPAIADRCEVIYNGIDAREFVRERTIAPGRKAEADFVRRRNFPPQGVAYFAAGIQDRCPAISQCSPRSGRTPKEITPCRTPSTSEMARCGRAWLPTTHSSPCRYSKANSSHRRATRDRIEPALKR